MNHVKKHVLWKDEYFERYYRLNPELVQKRLDKIYQAEDDLMVLISTQLFCFLQANDALYFDGCYKTGKADNSLLCTNLALWSIGLACDHFDIREERGHTILLSSDDELVRTGLITLCDKHLEWTDFHNSDKRCCLTGYEIQRQDLLLWPFEYQAVKNWRARQGLSTPMIEHPLMNSPMTTANCPDFSQWQRPEWFNPLVDFLAQRRPELAFLRHLFI
ncbi:hypothetical protein DSS38_04715 [Salmonella enterica subsp. enterica]|nr:hypothetical protein [Salmonella enterica subsp. enterica serovar Potsdam]